MLTPKWTSVVVKCLEVRSILPDLCQEYTLLISIVQDKSLRVIVLRTPLTTHFKSFYLDSRRKKEDFRGDSVVCQVVDFHFVHSSSIPMVVVSHTRYLSLGVLVVRSCTSPSVNIK